MIDDEDPFALFERWYKEAAGAGLAKPQAMALATADEAGRPGARMVLMTGFDRRGFVFHTSRQGRKGRELAHRPRAALLFWWDAAGYQVRVEGGIENTTAAEADACFARRPRGSQLAAWAATEGPVAQDRAELEARLARFAARYEGRDVPRPPQWLGYRVVPDTMEFWRQRDSRLHERLRFRRGGGDTWVREVLAP